MNQCEQLTYALNIRGFMVVICGESEAEIQVLCERVVDATDLVKVSCLGIERKDELWKKIGCQVGMSSMVMQNTLIKQSVIEYFIKNHLILLVKDYYQIEKDLQLFFAHQFKDVIRKGMKVVLMSNQNSCNEILCKNPDLQGRITYINV